jgi:hypothetical protein
MNNNKWTNLDIKNNLNEFYDLYKSKPISNNDGGMKFPHMFLMWYLVKKISPEYLIESGVWRGLGTWFIEKASPNTKIICIDPNPNYRIYTSKNAIYFTEDFSTLNFNIDPEKTLIFFDDHQNSLDRIKQCKDKNFKKMIFEDNYPYDQGDCYSIKKILSNKNYIIDSNGHRKLFQKNDSDYNYLIDNISIYQEMPPIHIPEYTRWNNKFSDYENSDQILNEDELLNYPEIISEIKDYTWLCYIELL